MGEGPAPRVLPEGVPSDAEPITEYQLERLPEYVQELIAKSMEGILEKGSPGDLAAAQRAFFEGIRPAVEVLTAFASNSTDCKIENVDESMEAEH